MRNVLFFLALGIAALVQFTHQLFPTFAAAGPAYERIHGLDSKGFAPPSPATWLRETATGERILVRPVCFEAVPTSEAPRVAPRREHAPRCRAGGSTTNGYPFLDL